MITLDEYEQKMREKYALQRENKEPTGIECPMCKAELCWLGDGLLASYPPKRNVHCIMCGFRTSVVV